MAITSAQSQIFGGGTFDAANPVPNVSTGISNAMSSLYGSSFSPTSYASTGTIPNTTPTTATKPMAVVTSEAAKNVSNTQQNVLNDINNTIAQTQSTRAANPSISIVDALNAKGQPSDFASRSQLANKMGITNYTGTADQNAQLIQLINNPTQKTAETATSGTASKTVTAPTEQPTVGKTVVNPNTGTQTTIQNVGQNPDGSYTVTLSDTPNSIRMDANTYNAMVSGTTPGTQFQGETGGVLSPYQQQLLNQQQSAYDKYNSTIQQIYEGTFLTPSQQSQIAATQATFDRIRSEQQKANANYEKLREQASFRGGQNITDPNQYLAQKQSVIQSGLDKIASIDSAAQKALADLKESFADKNAKRANEAYTTLRDYLKEKNNLIQKAVDDAKAMEKDVRDYNFKLQEYTDKQAQQKIDNENKAKELADKLLTSASNRATDALQREKLTWDIKKVQNELVDADMAVVGANAANLDYYNALTNASIGLPQNQRKEVTTQLNNLMKQGDLKGAQELIIRTAFAGQPAAMKEDSIRRLQARDELGTIKNELDAYVAKTGDTGILTGNMQKIQQKLGASGDPELAKVNARITQALGLYRQAITGAAWGEQETAEYKSLFPDLTNTNKLNTAIIESMTSALDANQRVNLGSFIGQGTYDKIFKPQSQNTPEVAVKNELSDKVKAGLNQGYAATEVVNAALKDPNYAPKIEAARAAGYSDDEIVNYLTQ